MLSVHALNLAYGERRVLHDLSLQIVPGQVLALIGPNGSGKSSLIRALSGVVKPLSGDVEIDGRNARTISDSERARLIAVVPQAANLPPAFTVFECVALGRTPHLNWLGKLGKADLAQIARALHDSETEDLQHRRAGELSGGEQQRVLLARALAEACPILLLDEPTAHLDLHHQVGLLGLVRRMAKEQNLAVLVALHDLNLASLYADRLALLVDGRIRSQGAPQDVLTSEILQSAYQVPLHVHPNPKHGTPWVVLERS